ncbi:MAG: MBL fold metallo-hydrolase [Victivallales bacterium]|nr:MBL fold metallo-hydrolase [Victivallales bacterium]
MMCCSCPVCTSADPRDQRYRAAALVEVGGVRLLLDCGPEIRLQLIRAQCTALDAVLLTHPHADHLNGIDDLLSISQHARQALPFYADRSSLKAISSRFDYIEELRYKPDGTPRWSVPQLEFHEVTGRPFRINGVEVIPLPIYHGRARTMGYRIGDMAYVCDCSRIPEETYPLLEGVNDLVIDALRWHAHPTHFSILQAEDEIRRIAPRRAWLTHLTHDVSHARDSQLMRPGVFLAYDTLSFNFNC